MSQMGTRSPSRPLRASSQAGQAWFRCTAFTLSAAAFVPCVLLAGAGGVDIRAADSYAVESVSLAQPAAGILQPRAAPRVV